MSRNSASGNPANTAAAQPAVSAASSLPAKAEAPDKKPTAHAEPKPKPPAEPPPGGLVIYDKGKVIYRALPIKPSGPTEQAASRVPIQIERIPALASSSEPVVLHRVEPEYPKAAMQAGIHGPVIVQIAVGQDGSVVGASVISGDPALSSAALNAVRQWRFQASTGSTVIRNTRITLDFDLPK
jgi:protein TonB